MTDIAILYNTCCFDES